MEVLIRLTPTDHRQLRLFLESPFFTQGYNQLLILELYDLIMTYQVDEFHPKMQKEIVFLTLYPNRVFPEKGKSPLDSLASDLFRLVRLFLFQMQIETEKDGAAAYIPLMQFYRKHGLEERFWQTVELSRKIQNEDPLRGAQYFLNQFKIEEEISNFQGVFNTHEGDANLNNANFHLDSYFSIVKLELACALEHRQKSSTIDSHLPTTLTHAVLEIIQNGNYIDSSLAKIYEVVISLIKRKVSEEDLTKLERLLDKHATSIPPEKYRDLLAYYRAFLNLTYVRSGSEKYLNKLFSVYDSHLVEGYLYIENKLTPMALRVLSNIGLKLHQFPWVKKLLDDHPPERICGTKYPVEAHSLNVAEYHFHKKEYAEAEAKLTYRAFENPNFSISADVLLIKIYYETGSELIESRMKALEQKVRRSKISAETKAGYYNFLKKLDKVIKYGWQKSSPKRDKLMEEIKTTPSVFAREWLLEKLN